MNIGKYHRISISPLRVTCKVSRQGVGERCQDYPKYWAVQHLISLGILVYFGHPEKQDASTSLLWYYFIPGFHCGMGLSPSYSFWGVEETKLLAPSMLTVQPLTEARSALPACPLQSPLLGLGGKTWEVWQFSICFTDEFKTASFPWKEGSMVKSCLYLGRQIISSLLGDKSFLSFSPLWDDSLFDLLQLLRRNESFTLRRGT